MSGGHLAPLKGGALVVGTVALSLATFMNVLDTSIANVSLPSIAGDLGVSPEQGTWGITSFGVANAISLPLTGWLSQRYGQVKLFTASILLFVLASLACGFAPTLELLILFRVIQGAVAGPMIPLSQTLLLSSYPKEKSGIALAMWSITTLVAPVIGPLLGGWLTDNVSWPWIFYINAPVGLVAAAATWTIYHRRETPTHRLPIDKVGLGLLVLWVGALQVMLDKGKDLDWFHSVQIVALAVAAALGLALFVVWELTDDHPLVDLRLFGRRNFAMGTAALSLGYGAFFGNVVLLPLWLQEWMGYTATLAGEVMAPVGLFAILLSPWVGKNVGHIDPRRMATFAFVGFAFVFWLRSRFNTQAPFDTILLPTYLQGIAMAFFFIPLQTIIFSGLRPDQLPAASGLSNFVRITAGSIGTSLFTTLWSNRAALHHAQIAATVDPGNTAALQTLRQLGARGLDTEQSRALVNRLVDQQAYTMGVTDMFYVSAALFLAMVVLVWLTRPRRGVASDVPGGAH